MTRGLPYYKRYPRDFIEGTIGLPFEVKTTYAFILDLIYMQEGRLPDDARYISGLLGCSVRKWNSMRQALIDAGKLQCFTDVSRNFLTNYRAVSEVESLRKVQDNSRENASRRWKNNNLADAVASKKTCYTEPDIKEKELSNESSKKKDAKRGTRLPDDWLPSPALIEWARNEERIGEAELNRETEKFCDYWISQPGQKGVKLDWGRTFKNWIRRSGERQAMSSRPRASPQRRMVDALMERVNGKDLTNGKTDSGTGDNVRSFPNPGQGRLGRRSS